MGKLLELLGGAKVTRLDITFEESEAWMAQGWSAWLPLSKDAIKGVPQLPGVYEVCQ